MLVDRNFAISGLDGQLADAARQPLLWEKPTAFDLRDNDAQQEVSAMLASGEITSVHDPIKTIAEELFEYNNPGQAEDSEARSGFVSEVLAEGASYGTWHYMPWSKELSRYPDKDEYRALRTSRNRNLVTDDEQAQLYKATPAVFGLSVGSSLVESLVMSGIGDKIIIGDPDDVSITNLNRLTGGYDQVGISKVDRSAIAISLADPYISQVHFRDGVTPQNLHVLAGESPTVVFDEVDNLPMKAQLRLFAKAGRLPLIMATDLGDRTLIDVERYDTEAAKPFDGRLDAAAVEELASGRVLSDEQLKYMTKITGLKYVTPRLLSSVMQRGVTLAGTPQDGTTARIGGADAAKAAREIILGRKMKSGRYVHDPKSMMHMQGPDSLSDSIATVGSFVRFMRKK